MAGRLQDEIEWRVSLTRLCWENSFIVEKVLNPRHNVVNVGRRGKMNTFAILIDPCVVETARVSYQTNTLKAGRGTYFDPAAIVGHDCCVQHSDMTP